MTEDEKAFLAQVALGWFEIRPNGEIWRNAAFQGGGTASLKWITPSRAERSMSKAAGYLRIFFRDTTGRKKVAAHRVVWMAISCRMIPSAMEINHKDGNKQNNHPNNLELVTRQENVLHAIRILGRKSKAQDGETNAMARLTPEQVMEIRALWKTRSMTQREIGERFGVKQTTIQNIVSRNSWKHLP